MANETDRLRSFVREVLGCGCSEQILRSITRADAVLPSGLGRVERIDVGRRLLVYLLRRSPTAAEIGALVTAGRIERDTLGFNRFRLAIAAGEGTDLQAMAQAVLVDVAAGDEKLHVHVVPVDALPALEGGAG